MKRAVLWDSSAVLALLDADDADHRAATSIAHEIAGERRPSFITNYVEVEAHALLLRKLGRALARQWLLSGGLPVVRVSPQRYDIRNAIVQTQHPKLTEHAAPRMH